MSRIQNPFTTDLNSSAHYRDISNNSTLVNSPDLDRCYSRYLDDPKGHPEAFFANAMKVADIVSRLR